MASPTIAILCVTHGRPDLVRECLESCSGQEYMPKEIVVLMNPADAVTEKAIRIAAPDARIFRTHRNIGFFPALNLALANTNADYVMIVDDDAKFLEDDALSRLIAKFRDEPRLGAVTCNLEGLHETPIQSQDQYIRVFTTGFTMFPRKVVTDWVGYVPDLFFRSAGETFWCTQLWEQRRPVKRAADVRMFHARAEEGRSRRDWYFHGLRSQILCAVMREPIFWLFPVLASKLVKSLRQLGKMRQLGVWLHAWASFLFHLPEALRFRKPVSVAARKLLARLDQEPVYDLEALPEWRAVKFRSAQPVGAVNV
jgi:GT2 family glycosyltransferase